MNVHFCLEQHLKMSTSSNRTNDEEFQQNMLNKQIKCSSNSEKYKRRQTMPNVLIGANNLPIKDLENFDYEQIQSWRTRFGLFVRDSKFGGVPFAILYGLYMYYLMTFLVLTSPTLETETKVEEPSINR